MILQDAAIRHQIETGQLVIRPMADNALQPTSIDLRLGRMLKIAEYRRHRLHDLVEDGPFALSQFIFALGATLEWVEVPGQLAGILAGKSTLARRGLILESAGYVDPGWRGELTVELFNLSPRPIALTHGMRIGQIRFEQVYDRPERLYGDEGVGSHYQGSTGPVEAAS